MPLPIKSTQERTSELRMQFPVSSGQHHRKTENEWIPVENLPKKPDPKPVENGKIDAEPKNKTEIIVEKQPVVPAPPNAPPGPQVFPTPLLEVQNNELYHFKYKIVRIFSQLWILDQLYPNVWRQCDDFKRIQTMFKL